MARARDIHGILRVALVWLLVLVALPMGSGPFERAQSSKACESWCPCDEAEAEQHEDEHEDEDEDCDEGECDEDCDGCCDARTAVVFGLARLVSDSARVESRSTVPALDAPGCRVVAGVFRPPRPWT